MPPPSHQQIENQQNTLAEREQAILQLAAQVAMVMACLKGLMAERIALREGLKFPTPTK